MREFSWEAKILCALAAARVVDGAHAGTWFGIDTQQAGKPEASQRQPPGR